MAKAKPNTAPAAEPRDEDRRAARINAALDAFADGQAVDWQQAPVDQLYAELFPDQITLAEFRAQVHARAARQGQNQQDQ